MLMQQFLSVARMSSMSSGSSQFIKFRQEEHHELWQSIHIVQPEEEHYELWQSIYIVQPEGAV